MYILYSNANSEIYHVVGIQFWKSLFVGYCGTVLLVPSLGWICKQDLNIEQFTLNVQFYIGVKIIIESFSKENGTKVKFENTIKPFHI